MTPSRLDPLVLLQTAGSVGVVTGAIWISLRFGPEALGTTPTLRCFVRLVAATVAVGQGLAVALVVACRPTAQDRALAIWLGVAGSVAWAWSWVDPGGVFDTAWQRGVLVVAATAAVCGSGFGLASSRRLSVGPSGGWGHAIRRALPLLSAGVVLSLLFVLGAEIASELLATKLRTPWPGVLVVAATLAALTVGAILLAITPGRDPLGLTERGRRGYVYAAEIAASLLLAHIRLTMPWLFSGLLAEYWPLIVVTVAFVGVGLGELFHRQQRTVLAEPLERTAALLPLLPTVGFWLSGSLAPLRSSVDYSLQLALVAGVYTALSAARRSFWLGVLGALAANGALWYFLHGHEGLGLLDHPQLWLIPAALSVLLAAHLDRSRLSATQMAAIRYAALLVIYVSSTADIFIAGVAESPWLPMVLAGLSVLGVLTGIALRVRSFLLLGTAFLVLALVTMVWHAAASLGWTWLWWVAGIVLGLALLALFALFEMRRGRMVAALKQLRGWEA